MSIWSPSPVLVGKQVACVCRRLSEIVYLSSFLKVFAVMYRYRSPCAAENVDAPGEESTSSDLPWKSSDSRAVRSHSGSKSPAGWPPGGAFGHDAPHPRGCREHDSGGQDSVAVKITPQGWPFIGGSSTRPPGGSRDVFELSCVIRPPLLVRKLELRHRDGSRVAQSGAGSGLTGSNRCLWAQAPVDGPLACSGQRLAGPQPHWAFLFQGTCHRTCVPTHSFKGHSERPPFPAVLKQL